MLLAHEKNWSRKRETFQGRHSFSDARPKINRKPRRRKMSRIIALTRVALTAMSEKKRWICTSLQQQINPHWSTTLEQFRLFLERKKWTEFPPPWRPTATTAAIQLTRTADVRTFQAEKGWGGLADDVTSRDRQGGAWNPALVFRASLGGSLHGKYANFPLRWVSCTVSGFSWNVVTFNCISFDWKLDRNIRQTWLVTWSTYGQWDVFHSESNEVAATAKEKWKVSWLHVTRKQN